jgi:hypothetical protein
LERGVDAILDFLEGVEGVFRDDGSTTFMGVFGDFNPTGEPKNAFLRLNEAMGDRGLWGGMSQIKSRAKSGTVSYQSQNAMPN